MILIYDIQGFPTESGLDLETFAKIVKELKIVLWDSHNYLVNPIEPKIIFTPEDEIIDIKIINVDDPENEKLVNEILKK